jgi:alkaline phosphatase D
MKINLRRQKQVGSIFLVLMAIFTLPVNAAIDKHVTTTSIAFGSCASQHKPQTIWDDIGKHQLDAFLFIGDNMYADIEMIDGERIYEPVSRPERFAAAYNELSKVSEFAGFREQVPLLMGTWDDHDYGANDAGKNYFLKHQSQQAFLDFFGFADNDPIRQQQGVYHAKTLIDDGRAVQIIMLDTRFHLGARIENPNGRPINKGPYIPQTNKQESILGEQQWKWLEQQLKQPADVRLLVSSIQVVAYEHAWEAWGNFPHERQRLYDLIESSQANGVVILSGDRHLMEISKDVGQLGHSTPYPMWDFTSSGLTQAFSEVNEANSFRQGNVVRDTHYGLVDIHWHQTDLMQSEIVMTAYGLDQKVFETARVRLGELQVTK